MTPPRPPSRMPDPHTIYQDWLDIVSSALLTGDPEGFTSRVVLPLIQRTAAAETLVEHFDDLHNDAMNLIQALRAQEVTHYIRLVKQARYLDENTIEGWHRTYVLRNATSVTPDYGSRMILRRIDGAWKVTEADHEMASARLPVTVIRSAPGSFAAKWAASRADISATQARAEPIYGAFLRSLTDAVNRADFDNWANHYTYPHEIHYDATDHTAHSPDDVHAFFEIMQEQMQTTPGTVMERSVRYAEFLADDRIVGYHETIMTHGGTTIFGPVHSRMMLTQDGGHWACRSVTNSLLQETPSESEFRLTNTLPTMRAIQERMRK